MSTTSTPIDGLALSDPEHASNDKELVNCNFLAEGRDTVSRYSKRAPVYQPSTNEPLPPPMRFRRIPNRQAQRRAQTRSAVEAETRSQTSHQPSADTTSGPTSLGSSELTYSQLDQLEHELYILLMSEMM